MYYFSRRDFVKFTALGTGLLAVGGLTASCAQKVPLKEFKQKVAMPGEEGFLEESNLEL